MKYLVFILVAFSILLVSCSNSSTENIKKNIPCLEEGIYCKGDSVYSCKNNDNGVAVENIVKTCEENSICSKAECIVNNCDDFIDCINGEKRCVNDKSYEVCGNFDSDICFEWKSEDCSENFHCEAGECVENIIKNPCDEHICGDFSTCQAPDDLPTCICDEGYHKKDGNCVVDCKPKTCLQLGLECGRVSDGCGVDLDCGTCLLNQSCSDSGLCIDDSIDCEPGFHQEGRVCVSNEKTVSCNPGDIPENSHHLREDVVIIWTEALGWPTASQCPWVCDAEFHFESENLNTCHPDTKLALCSSQGLPINSNIFDSMVTITWNNGFWTEAEKCLWECPEGRHIDVDISICVFYEDDDYCDGLDNNNDQTIDNCLRDEEWNLICDNVEGSSCMDGCFGKSYNNHIYYFCSGGTAKNWANSKSFCENLGASLVTINNQAENNFITSVISQDYWIGYTQGNNDDDGASWYWSDGSSVDAEPNWESEEPNNTCVHRIVTCRRRENCAEIYGSNGKWNDSDCEDSLAFICEKSGGNN